ncbi:MAG TPA: VOC family protein [Kofleriaceae bacterium]|nr:VOC family protein [Kofleriaceae bacterium]
MERVRGIGGVFFKSKDPKALGAWYQEHLGVPLEWGMAIFRWAEHDRGGALTVWTPFAADTKYFAPSESPFMINFRVDDLDRVRAQLLAAGVTVDDKIEESEFGRFGWAMDPDGNKIELWQPPPAEPGPKVAVFFYGSYMNRAVLAEAELTPTAWQAASLPEFDLTIAPRANLVPAPGRTAWGVLTETTHVDLARLYDHARSVLGETYLPHPVIVHPRDGAPRPALCYLSPKMEPRPAEAAYIDRILAPARELDLPSAYLAHIDSFRPR